MKCGDVLSDGLNLRPVNFDDRKILFEWRNDSLTRKNSLHTETVNWEKHCQWFEKILDTIEARGEARGEAKGKELQARETAINLKNMNMDEETIARAVGRDTETVKKWISFN